MHIPDLSEETYNDHGEDGFKYRSVAWLGGHVTHQGDTDPTVVTALRFLRRINQLPDDWRGLHTCEICGGDDDKGEFFVEDCAVRYVLPNMVLHYIIKHQYKLPDIVDAAVRRSAVFTSPPAPPYAEARAKFQTHLLRKGPAPQRYRPISPPPGARQIPYSSGTLTLKAWVSVSPADGQRRSAILFLHGGFAVAEEDWEMAKSYRDAGFVVLMPMLRGENGLPGDYSLFFYELDDVLAAAEALAGLPYVRTDHVYVAGHSVGGTLALLAAMRSDRFRAAASFSGSPDQSAWSSCQPEVVPFDTNDAEEFQIRSPLVYATSFQCPVRLYYGGAERLFAVLTADLAELALGKGLDVHAVPVAGDQRSYVAEAMQRSIEFFRERRVVG